MPQQYALMGQTAFSWHTQWPKAVVFALGYALACVTKGIGAGLFTVVLSVLFWGLYRVVRTQLWQRRLLAYVAFFATSLLTASGQIGVLTGFGGSAASRLWLGVSFVMAALALHVYSGKLSFATLWGQILQPARWNSGPCALPASDVLPSPWMRRGRVWVYGSWVVLGAFFYGVLAAAIAPLLVLKDSPHALDIIVFAALFEAYVYFNFSGISFMVFGVLSLAGVRTSMNFNSPFSARDVMGYWRRWHMSLSAVLKVLFFNPVKARLGLPAAVFTVFLCSALWHGMSLNFVLWGLFHACGWLIAHTLANQRRWLGVGRGLNLLLLPFVIVLGRLIFSDADTQSLYAKFQHLVVMAWSDDAWLLNLTLDMKSRAVLLMAALYVAFEVLRPRFMRRYKPMRERGMVCLLVVLCLTLGVTGMGGIYGAR